MFAGPIPGQSLTKEPKNYPWENPPQMVDVDEVITFHLNKLTEEDSIDNLLLLLESGMPISTLVEIFLTSAVMTGQHTVDVSMLVAPVIHEYMVSIAEDAEITFKEFFTEDEEGKINSKVNLLLKKALEETPEDEQDSGYELIQEMSEAVQEEPVSEEVPEQKPKGLMSRGNDNAES